MALLPKGSQLLKNNPINGMPGFYLDERFFFVPGFPQMAHPMILEALDRFFPPKERQSIRKSITVKARESQLIDLMESLPKCVELSSLPQINTDSPRVVISLSSEDSKALKEAYDLFISALKERQITYNLGDTMSQ